MALPYALRYTKERNLDQAIWKLEDFINKCEKGPDGKCLIMRAAVQPMKWSDGLAISAWEHCRNRVSDPFKRGIHSSGDMMLIKERTLEYGSGVRKDIDEGLSFGGRLNQPMEQRAFEIVMNLLLNEHSHKNQDKEAENAGIWDG